MPRRVRIGEVVEVPTAKGLAYAQYSHWHPEQGELLRVLPGFHVARPPAFEPLARQPERFVTFAHLQAAVSRGLFAIVAREAVPERARRFPLFRVPGLPDHTGQLAWWLWDGEREWRIGQLTPDHVHLPIRAVWRARLLVERIEQGWTPELETASHVPNGAHRVRARTASASQPAPPARLHHDLYFPSQAAAGQASVRLRGEGYDVEVHLSADGQQWCVRASHPAAEDGLALCFDLDEREARLQALAEALDGDYDGHELVVAS